MTPVKSLNFLFDISVFENVQEVDKRKTMSITQKSCALQVEISRSAQVSKCLEGRGRLAFVGLCSMESLPSSSIFQIDVWRRRSVQCLGVHFLGRGGGRGGGGMTYFA